MKWLLGIADAILDSKGLKVLAYLLVKKIVNDPNSDWDDEFLLVVRKLFNLTEDDVS